MTSAFGMDWRVRATIYDAAIRRGTLPSVSELVEALRAGREEVTSALDRLADAHVLVLQPGSHEILMAMPFSAVPTSFDVTWDECRTYANCAWDALGVPAMTRRPAVIRAACACCGHGIRLEVDEGSVRAGGEAPAGEAVIHFALPVREWWRDVVYT
jgi:hypothetical protein